MKVCTLCSKPFTSKGKLCGNCTVKIRRYRLKIAAIDLLGGKCVNCGNDQFPILEFHHKDGVDKDFQLSSYRFLRWEAFKKEVLKCELLCSNCHKLRHAEDANYHLYLEHARFYNNGIEVNAETIQSMGEKQSAKNHCVDCGKNIYKTSQRCRSCDNVYRHITRSSHPDIVVLENAAQNNTDSDIDEEFDI